MGVVRLLRFEDVTTDVDFVTVEALNRQCERGRRTAPEQTSTLCGAAATHYLHHASLEPHRLCPEMSESFHNPRVWKAGRVGGEQEKNRKKKKN